MLLVNIRNFSIIAHVDHGKSTLADRFLEITGTIAKDKLQPQLLDSLALERERGITIKLAPVRLKYTHNSKSYMLNLIDTPGHVDFSYEVSRSLAAVEGAILLVDATQGVQAQTLSHGLAALEQRLTIIPVINKIDLPNARVEECAKELADTFGFRPEEIYQASGKTGQGVAEILSAIVEKVPPPPQEIDRPLRALVFGSFFDAYRGVIAQVRVVEGRVPSLQTKIVFLGTGAPGQVIESGYFAPELTTAPELMAGEVGWIATGIKEPNAVRVGDTIATEFGVTPLPGYQMVKPMVFVGLYPIENADYPALKEALAKFRLTDPAFSFLPEHSMALGAGFRCGFLGLLHAEVVQQRLAQEYGMQLLATTPSVAYKIGDALVQNPAALSPIESKGLEEPWVKVTIFAPQKYLGAVMELVQDRRGIFMNRQHLGSQVELSYQLPLAEMVTDFYDQLKSVSSGFASLDWEFMEFRPVDAVRLDIMVADERIDALSTIVVREKAYRVGRTLVEKLKTVLPRQNFAIALQAAIAGKIIARETVPPYRKDVIAKLYGGDRTRKDKLLKKQKQGKKRMKMVGRVEIPQEAFLSLLKS